MILSLGLNGQSSSKPSVFIAILIISFSGIPKDLFCFFKKYFPASTNTFLGTNPINSEPVTLIPLKFALSHVLSKTSCNGDSLIFVRLYEICAIPYSSIYHPIPFTSLNKPGSLTGIPFLSFTILPVILFPSLFILPASLISKAIAFALLVDVVFKLML